MHAIRLHAFGPAANLVIDLLEDLVPSPDEVRIAVEACGVHLLDTTLRRGEPGPMPAPELPTIPGRRPSRGRARSLDRLAAGEWSPLVSAYPLAEAARAHADLEQRRALGKVVLTVQR